MPADPGLWYGTSPSTPTSQVKGLWVYPATKVRMYPAGQAKPTTRIIFTRAGSLNSRERTRDGADMAP